MEKKLPGVFRNPIEHEIKNNETVFYGAKAKIEKVEKMEDRTTKISRELFGNNVQQKINQIFNSPNYVYKAAVEIELTDKTITKTIVGKNNNHLITIDNELIPISNIVDIRLP